jgi:hypothetical protein
MYFFYTKASTIVTVAVSVTVVFLFLASTALFIVVWIHIRRKQGTMINYPHTDSPTLVLLCVCTLYPVTAECVYVYMLLIGSISDSETQTAEQAQNEVRI